MKILITGSNGQLGNELIGILNAGESEIGQVDSIYAGAEVTGVDIGNLDITDFHALSDFVQGNQFDLIINCAAMTNVDACECDYETAMKVNAIGARNMALVADLLGAKIVHVSTDYVFDGDAKTPYCEWDAPNPSTIYGKSKLLGERYVRESCERSFIVRTAWLYGYVGNNFVKTIIKLASERESIKVVDDQVGNPTSANDLAHHILKIARAEDYGIYHCTCDGICSWYDFAKEIVRLAGLTCEVVPCTTEEFPRPAPRPAYSAMDNLMLRSTVGDETRPWAEALSVFMKNQKDW
ncbi:MAG: dTDP-4-dehydrorhamnose reductase [Clostridiales Family XIII bacterium]|nr:dTDP-4-dehydrorhamnose reductase [Clostridiales Family XIII bacterium]